MILTIQNLANMPFAKSKMSVVSATIETTKKGKLMKTPTDLKTLQAQYDTMVKIAYESDFDLDPTFERELTQLMRLIKSMGGNVH